MPGMQHPSQRFRAPSSITAGSSLAQLMDQRLVGLIAEAIGVDPQRLRHLPLADLGLMQRAQCIGDAMAQVLGRKGLAEALIAGMGPPLTTTVRMGLSVFYYLPYSACIASHLVEDIPETLRACHALTRRFTAEWAIRPALAAQRPAVLAGLRSWTEDADPHVRRLVSEGTRPRLPWGMRLPVTDHTPVIALLNRLKDDPEAYVRRSVANHIGDLAKESPNTAYDLCAAWVAEVANDHSDRGKQRRALVRHAVRLPARQGVQAAVHVRLAAAR
jgi:3-methyladenine DNA glycosylase AlkC